jgi:hypothetical protein
LSCAAFAPSTFASSVLKQRLPALLTGWLDIQQSTELGTRAGLTILATNWREHKCADSGQ